MTVLMADLTPHDGAGLLEHVRRPPPESTRLEMPMTSVLGGRLSY